jgi:(1->4)-alpha-D-glucan 1-alpha-D-glucosylmutase
LLHPALGQSFLAEFLPFQRKVARLGMMNSLSQLLLKLTSPGVPDFYQGCELWDFSLVDPDNRRPVDFARRNELLFALKAQFESATQDWPRQVAALLENPEDGRIKLYLTWRALSVRRRFETLFLRGDYQPLPSQGERAAHLCAFSRRLGKIALVVVAPRWFAQLGALDRPLSELEFGETFVELPRPNGEGRWVNAFTGQAVQPVLRGGRWGWGATGLLRPLPYALLLSAPA